MPQLSGLDAVIRQGAGRRRHLALTLGRAVLPAAAAGFAVAFAVYIAVVVGAGRSDWSNTIRVAIAAGIIPIIAVMLLLMGTRRSYPFTMSLAGMVFASSLVIAAISAFRIPMSFAGVFLTLPGSLFFVTLANLVIVRTLRRNVALLDFPGAPAVLAKSRWPIPVVTADDISADVTRVLIDPGTHHNEDWAPVLARLYLRGVQIEAWPSYVEGISGRVDLSTFDLANVSYTTPQIFYYRAKRMLDLFGVALVAVPVAIVCALIWSYIRIIDGGPSIFVQERRGYGGSVFRLYKFRTMYKGDHQGSTTADDKRILPGCRLLRQLRLDELPQLINIAKGEMSVIGPRPVSVPIAEALEARIPLYVNRHIVVPGLTGWAQVSQGYATSQDEEIEKLSYDLYYLKNVSLDLDIIIMFRTIRTILLRIGAR